MKLFDGLESIVKRDEPLAHRTWFHIGGPAEYFVQPQNLEQLAEVVCRCSQERVNLRILGDGANLLVDDAGVKGVVLHLSSEAFTSTRFADGLLEVGAGRDLPRLVLYCVRQGWTGLECLTGIPGSIGGCVRMNAGGRFGDVGSLVESVEVMDNDGAVFTRTRDDLVFGYRSTNINSKIILGATFRLMEDDPHRILRQVKEIWIYKKNSQPLGFPNAGCIFKNPRGLSAGRPHRPGGHEGPTRGRGVRGAEAREFHPGRAGHAGLRCAEAD